MKTYECVFIARQDLAPKQVDEVIAKFTEVIKTNGGELKSHEYCGLRPLAYPIDKSRKGHYVIMYVVAPGTLVTELERTMQLREDILRYLTIEIEAIPEGPSPLLKQSRAFGEGAAPERAPRSTDAPASNTSATA